MNKIFFALLVVASCVGLAIQAGCNKNTFGCIDITGKITVDGKPVAGISVNMNPVAAESGQRAAAGVTKEDGTVRFVAPGSQVAGVMPGEYILTFQKEIWIDDSTGEEYIPGEYDPSKPEPKTHPKALLPKKYMDKSQSEFKVNVVDKTSTFEFDLQSE